MKKFKDYIEQRLLEDMELTPDEIQSMILKSLGVNSGSKEATNTPLSVLAEPGELAQKLNSLNGLRALIQNHPGAIAAISAVPGNNLTVGQLAGILASE